MNKYKHTKAKTYLHSQIYVKLELFVMFDDTFG